MFTCKPCVYPDILKCNEGCIQKNHILVSVQRVRNDVDLDVVICSNCFASTFAECRKASNTVVMYHAQRDAIEWMKNAKNNAIEIV